MRFICLECSAVINLAEHEELKFVIEFKFNFCEKSGPHEMISKNF